MLRQRIAIAALLLLTPVVAKATPSAPTVTGEVTHGQNITLSGTGFLTHATPAPRLFDKVSNVWTTLTNGQAIPAGTAPWNGDSVSYYNTANLRHSRVTADYYNTNSPYNFVDGFNFGSYPTRFYMSWWFKSTAASGKYLRVSDAASVENDTMSWGDQATYCYSGEYCTCIDIGAGGCGSQGSAYGDHQNPTINQWNFLEIWWDNTANQYHTRMNGQANTDVQYVGTPQEYTISCTSLEMSQIWKVGVDSGGASPVSQTSHLSEIYIDDTWSRVMIGNASSYATSTHFEMQPPVSWSDTSIEVTVNQGSFADGSTAFLYVVDSAGAVNPTGTSITFGEGAAEETVSLGTFKLGQ